VNGSAIAEPEGAADVEVAPEVGEPLVVAVALVVALVDAGALAVPVAFAVADALVVPLALVAGLLLLLPQATDVTLSAMIAITQVRDLV
jgi:hypothetical protein